MGACAGGVDQVEHDRIDQVNARRGLIWTDDVVERTDVAAKLILAHNGVVLAPALDQCPGAGVVDGGIARIGDRQNSSSRWRTALGVGVDLIAEQKKKTKGARVEEASAIFDRMMTEADFAEFLTLVAYDYID